jgi:hypothetical protein
MACECEYASVSDTVTFNKADTFQARYRRKGNNGIVTESMAAGEINVT